ncbi:TIGR00153 family protein [Candidatus Chlamydia sanziniae]|uniref:Phosphate transport regulator PhoU-like protein n=1 Tax=Candidatus Chlamydia sanziniae TaxID=1806891 RepID=A0A1A9HX35_9CHLA|nr:TIGR00153 family protein [Candidatus Chlamydia sanziniae]ANH78486.1 Phosphate transport regulator PhoU-like protein [Candidatus Chlamydia sanziniae]
MQTLARLFGQSPFAPLQAHLEVVTSCVNQIFPMFTALRDGRYEELLEMAKIVSDKEYQADCIKNDMRNHLPVGLFMPISRAGILEIISIQDSIADTAEDVAILLTIRHLSFYPSMEGLFFQFLEKNLEAFKLTMTLLHEFNQLLESSFGGRKADKARVLVGHVAKTEHESDVLQRELMQVFFSDDFVISEKEFYLWLQVIRRTAGISDSSEKLAHRINMTLEEK